MLSPWAGEGFGGDVNRFTCRHQHLRQVLHDGGLPGAARSINGDAEFAVVVRKKGRRVIFAPFCGCAEFFPDPPNSPLQPQRHTSRRSCGDVVPERRWVLSAPRGCARP